MSKWWERYPKVLADVQSALRPPYHELVLSLEGERANLTGWFRVEHEGRLLDSYEIELVFPERYPFDLPTVRETGGRVPPIADRHNSFGACLFVPFEWKVRRPDAAFRTFLDGPVRGFFLGQSMLEEGVDPARAWPAGERRHGYDGIHDAIREMLQLDTDLQVRNALVVLMQREIKPFWLCPCDSGKRMSKCHWRIIARIHHRETAAWLRRHIPVDADTARRIAADVCRSPAGARRRG